MCGQNGPILLAEDEPGDAELFLRAVKKAGLEQPLAVVRDGDEALEYLQGTGRYSDRTQHPAPTMIVLDIKMPRRSGFEVLNWVRRRTDQLRHIPVMMLSSSNFGRDVIAAYEAGANAYVGKPGTAAEYGRMAGAFASFWMQFNEQASCPRMIC